MKRRTIATALNFVVPGAGLWYLGRIRSGVLNLLVAILVPVAVGILVSSETTYSLYAVLAVAAGSAGFAHAAGTSEHRAAAAREAANGDSGAPA
ncbi:MAG: hypothetical protein RIK87_15290 [Fuerstiella sp.]